MRARVAQRRGRAPLVAPACVAIRVAVLALVVVAALAAAVLSSRPLRLLYSWEGLCDGGGGAPRLSLLYVGRSRSLSG